MKASYNLLKKYVDFPEISPQELSLQIAEHCFEVEKVEEIYEKQYDFSNVFAAKVLTKDKHPNADRLKIVTLDLGEKGMVSPVVCGADNYEPGDMVALALPGAFIPNNIHSDEHESFILGSAIIRGIESHGMICSGFELGVNDKPEEKPEILILPKTLKPGTDLREYLNKKSKIVDYLFEFSLPANRPDLHSHIGIAREIAGMLDDLKPTAALKNIQSAISVPKIAIIKNTKTDSSLKLGLETKKSKAYFGARLKVRIAKTDPEILKTLKTIGQSSVNNVVDITNFVMSNVGQPMHAYDATKIIGKIKVKEANGGEEVEALDSKKYKLSKGALVIADDKNILGVAGIIGGNDSRITESTEEIILEAALFDGVSIRKNSKAIGLRTDASSLFEKGTAPEQAVYALMTAIDLLKKYAAAELLEINYVLQDKNLLKTKESLVKFDVAAINDILGADVSEAQVKKFLPKIGIPVSGSKNLIAKIPWYRQDISDSAGIADEVVRYIGMNEALKRQPLSISRNTLIHNAETDIWQIKEQVADLGYSEIQTYAFLSQKDILEEKAKPSEYIKITNPLSSETEYLRKNLFTSILKIVKSNAKHFDSFKLFEVGFGYRGYLKEDLFLGLSIFNNKQQTELSVSQIKGDLMTLSKILGALEPLEFSPLLLSENAIQVSSAKEKDLGSIKILDSEDLSASVVIASLYLEKIIGLCKPKIFKAYGKFPESSLDVSIIVDDSVKWGSVEDLIRESGGSLLKDIQIIDAPYLYKKGSLSQFHKNMLNEGKKNILFRLVFASEERTLSSSEISEIHAIITKGLKDELNAEIR